MRLRPGMIAVIGVPWDENSSFMRGPAEAPDQIRQLFHSGSSNQCAENGIDLGTEPRFVDVGDLELNEATTAMKEIEVGITSMLERDVHILALGGDHSVSYPIVKAHARKYQGLNILHLDAHPDLYDVFEGNRFSHACPFARIMEEGLASRLVQIGIRTMNAHQLAQGKRFGVEVIEARVWPSAISNNPSLLDFEGPVYLSLDMDVLDPAFAPGVSHHEPGGLSSRDILHIIQGVKGRIVGADVVELNPARDLSGITTMAAVKFLKEIASQMLVQLTE